MKIQCQLCKELVVMGGFQVSGAGIDITCSSCGGSFHVDSATGAVSEAPTRRAGEPASDEAGSAGDEAVGGADVGADEMRCPKCMQVQRQAPACKSCGLSGEHFAGFAADGVEPSAELEAGWRECLDDWDDGEAHDRFVETAAASGGFPYAARSYRQILADRPDDDIAARQLARLSRMAEALLVSSANVRGDSGERPQPYRNLMIVLVVLFMLGGVLAVWLLLKGASSDAPTRVDKPAPAAPAKR